MDWRILYNPLAALGKGRGFLAALVVVAALTIAAWWGGVHLDGALDLHITPERPSAGLVVGESLTAWLTLGIFLFIAAKLFGGNGGVGAHLAAAGLSRFPYVLAAIITSRQLLGGALLRAVSIRPDEIAVKPQALMSPALIIAAFATLLLVIWSIVVLYLGYNEASRLQRGKVVAAFLVGLIVAEVVSKILVAWLFRIGI